jgi:hypothetical protein
MNLKRKLFSNMFLRNMAADLFGRSAYSKTPGSFIPYFLYRIGQYQPDEYLYFPKEPYSVRYYNEMFNKLYEYKGYGIITYLQFHYAAYLGKNDFLRFLQYEIADRLKRRLQKVNRLKLQAAAEWDLTLLDLEAETNIPNGRLSKIENGLVNVEFITIARIAEALGVEIMELFNYVGPLPSNR